jgi:hypothetical protein
MLSGTYYTKYALGQFPSIILDLPGGIYGEWLLWGPTVLQDTFIPISNPTSIHTNDLLVTFIPGTYSLQRSTSGWGLIPIAPYTLTITQESSGVPEPASLVLLATGMVGVGGAIRSRMRG